MPTSDKNRSLFSPNVKPRSLGFQTDIAVLRTSGSLVEDRGHYLVVRSPHNPTFWWGNFLLLGAVPGTDGEDVWLDRFASEFPDAAHVALGVDGTDNHVADLHGFAARGLQVIESTVMTSTDVRAPAHQNDEAVYRRLHSDQDWVQSIELHLRCEERPFNPDAYRAYVTTKATTNRQVTEAGDGGWFGAFVDDRLVAQMGLVRAGPGLARFQTVETDPDSRRRGLAASLLHHVCQFGLGEMGAQILVMVADPDYFAIDLYRSLGFVGAETQLQMEESPPLDAG
jgi:ribosomal protein S18 acetylase RimI-like enzyme